MLANSTAMFGWKDDMNGQWTLMLITLIIFDVFHGKRCLEPLDLGFHFLETAPKSRLKHFTEEMIEEQEDESLRLILKYDDVSL